MEFCASLVSVRVHVRSKIVGLRAALSRSSLKRSQNLPKYPWMLSISPSFWFLFARFWWRFEDRICCMFRNVELIAINELRSNRCALLAIAKPLSRLHRDLSFQWYWLNLLPVLHHRSWRPSLLLQIRFALHIPWLDDSFYIFLWKGLAHTLSRSNKNSLQSLCLIDQTCSARFLWCSNVIKGINMFILSCLLFRALMPGESPG